MSGLTTAPDPVGADSTHGARAMPLRERLQRHWRTRRMRAFAERLGALPGVRILDLGGNIEIWALAGQAYRLTLLNTSEASAGTLRPWRLPTNGCEWQTVVGDASDLSRFGDASFDIVFSNSVIEHLGDEDTVARFASEVRRVGRSYWIQTPAHIFPIEAHTGLPFYWRYPRRLREAWAGTTAATPMSPGTARWRRPPTCGWRRSSSSSPMPRSARSVSPASRNRGPWCAGERFHERRILVALVVAR